MKIEQAIAWAAPILKEEHRFWYYSNKTKAKQAANAMTVLTNDRWEVYKRDDERFYIADTPKTPIG